MNHWALCMYLLAISFAYIVHEMDGDSLLTLIGVTPGPDCLKDLVPKIGTRLKVYRCIKACYDEEISQVSYHKGYKYFLDYMKNIIYHLIL